MRSYEIIDNVLHVFADTGVHDYCEDNGIAKEDFNQPIIISKDIKSCDAMLSGFCNFNQPLTIPLASRRSYIGMMMGCTHFNSEITWYSDEVCPVDVVTDSMFIFCSYLQSISFPKCRLKSAHAMFRLCTALSEIDMGCCTEIKCASFMFSECFSLGNVKLPSCIDNAFNMFASCSELQTVDGLYELKHADEMFRDCHLLKAITPETIYVTPETSCGNAFAGCNNLGRLHFTISEGPNRYSDVLSEEQIKAFTCENISHAFLCSPGVFDKVALIYNPPEAKDCSVSTNLFN